MRPGARSHDSTGNTGATNFFRFPSSPIISGRTSRCSSLILSLFGPNYHFGVLIEINGKIFGALADDGGAGRDQKDLHRHCFCTRVRLLPSLIKWSFPFFVQFVFHTSSSSPHFLGESPAYTALCPCGTEMYCSCVVVCTDRSRPRVLLFGPGQRNPKYNPSIKRVCVNRLEPKRSQTPSHCSMLPPPPPLLVRSIPEGRPAAAQQPDQHHNWRESSHSTHTATAAPQDDSLTSGEPPSNYSSVECLKV